MRAEQKDLRIHARYRDGDLVRHPDGGVRTVAQTASDQDKQRGRSKPTSTAARPGTGGSPRPCAGSRSWSSAPTRCCCCTSSPA